MIDEPGVVNGPAPAETTTEEGTCTGVANGARLLSRETTLCCRL